MRKQVVFRAKTNVSVTRVPKQYMPYSLALRVCYVPCVPWFMWPQPTHWLSFFYPLTRKLSETHKWRAGLCLLREADYQSKPAPNELRVWRNRPYVDGRVKPELEQTQLLEPSEELPPSLCLFWGGKRFLWPTDSWFHTSPATQCSFMTLSHSFSGHSPLLNCCWVVLFHTDLYAPDKLMDSSFEYWNHCKYWNFQEWPFVLLHVWLFCVCLPVLNTRN